MFLYCMGLYYLLVVIVAYLGFGTLWVALRFGYVCVAVVGVALLHFDCGRLVYVLMSALGFLVMVAFGVWCAF